MPIVNSFDLQQHLNLPQDEYNLDQQLATARAWVESYTGGPIVDDSAVPAPINQAILLLAAHLYANREASLVGVSGESLPFGMLELLSPYRAFSF